MRTRHLELYDDERVYLPGPHTVDIRIYNTLFRLICSPTWKSKYVSVDLARIIGSPVSIQPPFNTTALCRALQVALENILARPVKTITPDLLDLEGK